MTNIKELYAEDTQLDLYHTHSIFSNCKKIIKMSITLRNDSWDIQRNRRRLRLEEVQQACQDKLLHHGFARLTHLKMTWIQREGMWGIVLMVLGWCVKCIALHLEPFLWNTVATNYVAKNNNTQLSWMKTNLEYFVYLKRGKKDAWDCNIDSFCNLLSDELKHKLLEQDKIRECKRANLGLNDSRMLFRGDLVDDCTIFNFSRSQDVPEFLANHSNLEGVILNCERGAAKMESSLGMEVTTMAHLRALVYQGWPDINLLKKLIEASPRLTWLQLSLLNKNAGPASFNLGKLPLVNAVHLKRLDLNGVPLGDCHLEEIFSRSCNLEAFLIDCQRKDDLDIVCTALPLAVKLRDLRLKASIGVPEVLMKILTAVGSCRNLERLFLVGDPGLQPKNSDYLPDMLLKTVLHLHHLIVLYLCQMFRPTVIEEVNIRFRTEILPYRPAFWFHLGDLVSVANNPPLLHLNQLLFNSLSPM